MVTRRQFGFMLREKIKEIAPTLQLILAFPRACLRHGRSGKRSSFCLLVDPDTPTWRAWLGYKNSFTGKDFKAPQRNAPAYLKVFEDHHDEITDTVVRELAAQPRTQPRVPRWYMRLGAC